MKLRITIEIELSNAYTLDEDEKIWMENEILIGDGNLILHSNEIGDEVGVVKKVVNKKWINESSK
jgi:hypothetical protein